MLQPPQEGKWSFKKSAFWAFGSSVASSISSFCAGLEVTDEEKFFSHFISLAALGGSHPGFISHRSFQKTKTVQKNCWKKKLLMVFLGKMSASFSCLKVERRKYNLVVLMAWPVAARWIFKEHALTIFFMLKKNCK